MSALRRVGWLRTLAVPGAVLLTVASTSYSDIKVSVGGKSVTVNPNSVVKKVNATLPKAKRKMAALTKTATSLLKRPMKFTVPKAHVQFALKAIGNGSVGTEADFKVLGSDVDKTGKKHSRFQQFVGGVPIFGGEMIVHAKADGTAQDMSDSLLRNPVVSGTAKLSTAAAAAKAEGASGCTNCLVAGTQPELMALPQGEELRLVYRVQTAKASATGMASAPVQFVDAETGQVLFSYDRVQSAVTAKSLYSGNVDLDTYAAGNGYTYLENSEVRFGTFDMDGTTDTVYSIVDQGLGFQGPEVDAQWGLGKALGYYAGLGRSGVDDAQGPGTYPTPEGTPLLVQRVNYGAKYNNAYWDGSTGQVTYGNGDGSRFGPLVSLDIIAHELTHGIVQYSADLVYQGESGALNESFADVFGAMVERAAKGESNATWLIGEDAYTPKINGDALRSLANPHLFGQPDHYSERSADPEDWGGVHANSGIPNHVFYLAAHGGKHRLGSRVQGMGADVMAFIWYAALTEHLTSTGDFAAARLATLNASAQYYGKNSDVYNAVCQAWLACGVGGTCLPQWLYNGRFDYQLAWSFSGTASLVTAGGYPHTANGYANIKASANSTGAVYQDVQVPSDASAANLTFYLNVSSQETVDTAKDKLKVEVLDSAGNLLKNYATYSNRNKAKAGAYSKKGPFDLSAYKGKWIRVQFRATGNASKSTTFRIDDVVIK